MVLTQTGDIDFADENHLVVIFSEDGVVDDIWRGGNEKLRDKAGFGQMMSCGFTCETFFVSPRHPHDGLGVPLRRLEEAFAVGVFADTFEDGAYGGDHHFLSCAALCCGLVQTGDGGFGWWDG